MSHIRRIFPLVMLLVAALLLLPAPAGESAPPPPAAEKPAAPADSKADAEDTPPDLGEDVSADNNVSFPVDI